MNLDDKARMLLEEAGRQRDVEMALRVIADAKGTMRANLSREPSDTEIMHFLAGMYLAAARAVSPGFVRANPARPCTRDFDTESRWK